MEREESEKWKNQETLHLGLQEFRHLEWVVSVGTKRKRRSGPVNEAEAKVLGWNLPYSLFFLGSGLALV